MWRSIAFLVLFALVLSASNAPAAEKPNIIVIFADDLGYGDLSCYAPPQEKAGPEGPGWRTPELDRMAREGARLTSFYTPMPYCAPSRASLLTGRYPFRHGVVGNPTPDVGVNKLWLPAEEVTIAEMLKESGYATACYGKWHLGHVPGHMPRTHGFDEYLGILYSNDMYPVQLVQNEKVVEYPVVQATLTRRYTDRAIRFVEKNRDRPFFLYLPHAMPHKPLAASNDFYTHQTPDDLYGDVIRELDHEVGRLLDALRRLELEENTLVIFTSDNGPWFGGSTGGLRGMKSRTWEGGVRVPMIARWPGKIPAGLESDELSGIIDLLPTIAGVAGVETPEERPLDGRDIWPLLTQRDAKSPHEAIFAMRGPHLAAVRSGKWKLHLRSPGRPMFGNRSREEQENWIDPRGPDGVTILAPYEQANPTQRPGFTTGVDPKPNMLFDLEQDMAERNDVADAHPEVVERLRALAREAESQYGEILNPGRTGYLFRDDLPGRPLMRVKGGSLKYDRVPRTQQELLRDEAK